MEWVLQLLDEVDDLIAIVRHFATGIGVTVPRLPTAALHLRSETGNPHPHAPLATRLSALRAGHGLSR